MRRPAILLILLAVFVAPAAAAAAEEAVPGAGGRPLHTIPFTLYDNRIYVEVSGPGFSARPFLLDTGAQVTHFTAELAARAGLAARGRIGISGTGSERIGGIVLAGTTLRIGSLALPVRRAIAAPAEALFGPVYRGTGRTFDGVIGHDLFAAYVVAIDYDRRQLRLFDADEYEAPSSAVAIPLRLAGRKPYLQGILRFADQPPMAANLHLDTGFGGAVSLNGRFVADRELVDRAGATLPAVMRGVGGATEARLARMAGLELGPIALARPIVSLALAQGAGVRSDSAGRIGGEILRRFAVTIAYARRTLWLEPNRAFDEPFEADMSGLTLLSDPDRPGDYRVSEVAAGSAAAEAGIRAGDRLLTVDGREAPILSLEEIRAALRADGARRVLRLLRDGEEREVVLQLRRRL